MKRFVLYGLIIFSVLSALASGFAFFSSQGLRACIHAVDRALPGRLSVASARGRLADRFTLEDIQYIDESVVVAVDTLSLTWSPAGLLDRSIIIRSLDISGVDLAMAQSETTGPDSAAVDIFSPLFSLPLSLKVNKVAVQSVNLSLPADDWPVQITALTLDNASVETGRIDFEQFTVAAPSYQVSAGGRIENGKEVAARFSVACLLHPEGYQPIEGTGEIAGSPAELHLSLQLHKPFAGVLQGTVYDLQANADWEVELRTDSAELAAISREWPNFIFSRFQAHGSGTLASYSLQVQADVAYEDIRAIHVQTAVIGDADGLRLSDTLLSRKGGSMAGEGVLDWREDFSWQAALTGTAVNPAEINPDWPDIALSDIVVSGRGVQDAYQLQVEAGAAYRGVQDVHLISTMEGDADGLRFTDAAISRMDAVVAGHGRLSWEGDFSWQATVEGSDVDPAIFMPQWPGTLDFQGRSSGMLIDDLVRAEIHLDSLEGELRDHPLRANGTIRVEGDNYAVDGFFLETAGSTLEAAGRFAETVDLRFALNSSDLAALWPDASGSLRATAGVEGSRQQPVFQLDLSGEHLSLNDVFIGSLTADAAADLSPTGEIRASVRANELNMAGGQLAFIRLGLHGLTENHRLQVEAGGYGTEALLVFDGGYREKTWEGHIDKAAIASDRFGNWQLSEPASLSLAGREISLAGLCLSGAESALICLAGELAINGLWQAQGDIRSLPLSLLSEEQKQLHDLQGLLAGTVVVEGEGSAILGGRLDLSAADASLLLPLPQGIRHRLEWRDNSLHAVYDNGLLTATAKSILRDGSFIHLSATLTDLHPVPFSLDGAHVDGSLEISIQDLEPWAALTYPNLEPSGSLQGNFSFLGPASGPALQGSAELVEGKMIIPPLGITLEELKMSMEAKDQALEFRLSGHSGGGEVIADTRFSWPLHADEPFIATITGDRFELIHSPELRLWVSPDLHMTVSRRQAEVKGTIRVPEAFITPRNLTGTVSPSRDVVIVGARPDQEQRDWSLHADVMVFAGENVRVDAFGLRGKVEGQLRVVDLPSKPVTGEGALQVKEGTFVFYGRGVQIETGRLLFSGGPIDNPGIEVRAENTTSGVTTGIQVSGFLTEPEISFYSSPPMAEDEIITRLLMNTSLIGSSGDDGGFLGGITEDTSLDKLSATVQEIRESLHVDDIRIETGRASEDLSLVIGTWLTPSLYVSYGKNLLKESGSFNTRYRLGRGFFLETETGSTQSGADFKYEIER